MFHCSSAGLEWCRGLPVEVSMGECRDHWLLGILQVGPIVLLMQEARLVGPMYRCQTVPVHRLACWRVAHRGNCLPVQARSRSRNSHNAHHLEEATSHSADTTESVCLQKVGSLKT